MSELSEKQSAKLLAHTADIVASYVSNHDIKAADLPDLISTVFAELRKSAYETEEKDTGPKQKPAVPIKNSLRDDVIICLEDGQPFQSLKRHLRVKYNLTPEAYRKKWDLPADYPMVAPDYAKRRSALAKRTGLGKKRGT